MLWFHLLLTLFSFSRSTLMDALHSMDVSHASGSHTLVFPFRIMSHQTRVLVCSRSRFTCFFTLPFWTVDSSMLTILSYAYSF